MCGGFPCNCCKPRLAIDTHFDGMDVPWKCFFRNRSAGGTYALSSNNYKRTDASVRPILDWPVASSQLQIPVWSGANNDRFRELYVDMKHPFDGENGDSPEATYSFLLDTDMPSGRRFANMQLNFQEVTEGDAAWYGGTVPSPFNALNVLGFSISINTSNLTTVNVTSPVNQYYSVTPTSWDQATGGGTSDGNPTGSNLFEITIQRTSTEYIATLDINSNPITFAATGETNTTSPFFDLVTPPQSQQWRIPKPWKHYRWLIYTETFPDISPPRSTIPNTPLYYDRIAISSVL